MLFFLKDLILEYVYGKGFFNCYLCVYVIEKKMGFLNYMLFMENNDIMKLQQQKLIEKKLENNGKIVECIYL